tara:strand:- start:197 stop:1228 length:1032 start_codon:yes stop_codon:yes gene_type:complete
MATKKKLSNNKYFISWMDHAFGTYRRFVFNGNLEEANTEVKKLQTIQDAYKNRVPVERDERQDISLAKLMDLFFSEGISNIEIERGHKFSENTIIGYRQSVKRLINTYGPDQIISKMDINTFKDRNRHLEKTSINRDLNVLSRICNWGKKNDHLSKSPVIVQYKIEHKEIKYLEEDDIRIIQAVASKEEYRLFRFFLISGFRRAEISAFTIDRVKRTLTVTGKGNKVRTVYITKECLDILSQWDDGIPPYDYDQIKYVLKKLSDKADIRFSTHTLRRTCGSLMLSSGCSIDQVADHLGHSDTKITRRHYAKLMESKREEAVELFEKRLNHLISSPVSTNSLQS